LSTFIVGDAHGHLEKIERHLANARLIDEEGHWAGAQNHVWFIGDFCDRGPDGAGVIRLARQLETEAEAVGGRARSIVGNHEPMMLAVARFQKGRWAEAFLENWRLNGGRPADLDALTQDDREWISELPALAMEGETMIVHADSTFYLRYGDSIEDINSAVSAVLHSDDPRRWARLMEDFASRREFEETSIGGPERAQSFMNHFGAKRLVHGHTPIRPSTGNPEDVTEPTVYNNETCINVDGGMYRGGPGFVYELSEMP
jgi:hypothetical protein